VSLDESSGGSDAGTAVGVGRRTALAGAAGIAALGAAAALAGCAEPVAPARSPGVPAAPGPPPQQSNGAGGSGTRLGQASEVPVGGGRIFAELEVVVTQPTAGDFRGFTTICTHTACNVTRVAEGTIDCPCHGSRFHLDGTVAAGPAPRPLPQRPVTVVDGQVVLR
jgi:Rieske Fe-S protein